MTLDIMCASLKFLLLENHCNIKFIRKSSKYKYVQFIVRANIKIKVAQWSRIHNSF